MVDESELRKLFAESEAPNRLDTGRIIARSRARRVPRVVGAAAIGTLAVAGIGVLGVQTLSLPPTTSSVMDQSAEGGDAGAAPESFETLIKRAPADRINLCAGPVMSPVPSYSGLSLDVVFPETAAIGTPVAGTVILTNGTAAVVTGTTTAEPAITLSRDGIVMWHSNGPVDASAVAVQLAPGESLEYPASFEPVQCDVVDDERESFRTTLPAVPAGQYEVSAAIDFAPDPSMPQPESPGLDLVMAPAEPVRLE
jgi:hypothetical protein